MAFSISADPQLQRLQLNDLIEESRQALEKLTSPVVIFAEEELQPRNHRIFDNISNFSYNPPPTRFAKISHY